MYERTKDLTGQRFGKLVALYKARKEGKFVYWRFRCDCGNEKEVRAGNVKQKTNPVTSCGCARGFEDLTGRIYGLWSVVARHGNDSTRNATWSCVCQCGQNGVIASDALRMGQSKSCGCSMRTRGGNSRSAEYSAWNAMIGRCHNTSDAGYKNYGGRGIFVCDEWRECYEKFLSHVGRRPSELHSIDRINNNEGYKPGNVRWATKIEQANNTRSNKLVTYMGITCSIAMTARNNGLSPSILHGRIKRGMPIDLAITKKKGKHEKY